MAAPSRTERSIALLRDCGPYLLIELLLPGGTLVALLLYLSRRFLRGGLSAGQYAARRVAEPVPVKAKPVTGRADLCLCAGHVAVLGSQGPQARCERGDALAACCCA